jgi:putative acetyltransferase
LAIRGALAIRGLPAAAVTVASPGVTSLRLRPEEPADSPVIRQVVAEAFARPDGQVPPEVGLVEALRTSDAWLPELSMVAEFGGELVGYALLTRVRVDPGLVPVLALGPVAVPPRRQRRGFGTAVVQAALDAATELGERLVVVLGAPAFYRRFGFSPGARFALTSPWSGLGDPWQALVLPDTASDPGPPPSGEVTYPQAWAQV